MSLKHRPRDSSLSWSLFAVIIAALVITKATAANNVSCSNHVNTITYNSTPLIVDNCPLLSIVLDTPNIDWTFTRCNITSIAITGANMTNVRLRFMDCFFGCAWDVAVGGVTLRNVSIAIVRCTVAYDAAFAKSSYLGAYFVLLDLAFVTQFTLMVADSSVVLTHTWPEFNLTVDTCNTGFLRIHMSDNAAVAEDVTLDVSNSSFSLPMRRSAATIGLPVTPQPPNCSSDVRVLTVDVYATMTLRRVNVTLARCVVAIEATSIAAFLEISGFVIAVGFIEVSDCTAVMNVSGMVAAATGYRDASLLRLSASRFVSGDLRLSNANMTVFMTAGNEPLEGGAHVSTNLQNCQSSLMAVSLKGSGALRFVVEDSVLESMSTAGYLSYLFATMATFGVAMEPGSSGFSVLLRNVTLRHLSRALSSWAVFCPYRRDIVHVGDNGETTVVNLMGLAVAFSAAVITFVAPMSNAQLIVVNCSMIMDAPDVVELCSSAITSGTVQEQKIPIPLPFSSSFAVTVITGGVVSGGPVLARNLLTKIFIGLPVSILDTVIAIALLKTKLEGDRNVLGVEVIAVSTLLSSPRQFEANDTFGTAIVCGCILTDSTVTVERTQLHTQALSLKDAVITNSTFHVFQGTSHRDSWPTGVSAQVATMSLGGVAALRDTVVNVSGFHDVMALDRMPLPEGSGVVELGGAPSIVGDVSWVFDGITVVTKRHTPFALFSTHNSTTPLLELRSIVATCVLWNGRTDAIPLGSAINAWTGQSVIASAWRTGTEGGCLNPIARPSITISLETPTVPGDEVGVAATYIGSASSAAAAFVALLTDVTASLDMQAAAVIGLSACASGGVRSLGSGPMVYLLSPFADLGALWSAGGNFLLMVAFGILHTMTMCVVRHRQPASHRDWAAAGVSTQFPNLSFAVCLFLMNGTSCFGMILAVSHPSVWAAVVGVWCVVWCAAVIAAAVLVVRKQHPNLRFEEYRVVDITTCGQWTVPQFLIPVGRWIPPEQRQAIGRLVNSVRERWGLFGVAPTYAASLVFNVIASLPASGSSGCVAQWCVLASIPMCLIVFMLRCQPTRVVIVSYITSVSNALLVAMCVIAALGSGKALDDDKVATAIEVVSILLSVTNGVRSAHTVYVMYLEYTVLNRQSAAPRRIILKQPKPVISLLRSYDSGIPTNSLSCHVLPIDEQQAALKELIDSICNGDSLTAHNVSSSFDNDS